MSNTNAKRMNKFFSILFFVTFGVVMSLGLIFVQSKNVADAEGETFYSITVTATNGSVSLSYVGDGEHYTDISNMLVKENETTYKILKSVVDDAENDFKIEILATPNQNYVFDSYSVGGVETSENQFEISGDTSVVVNFVPQTFDVKVSTSFSSDGTTFESDDSLLTNNMGVEFDQIKVDAFGSIFDSTKNIVATSLRDSDKLEFLGFFIKGVSENEIDVTDGLKIKTLNVDEEFIRNNVNQSGEIEIIAKYAFKKQVNISVAGDSTGLGSFKVFIRNSKNELVDFVSGNYYSFGSRVSVVPVAEKNYAFVGYNIGVEGKEIYGDGFTKEIAFEDVSLVLSFAPQKYEIKFSIVNSIGESIGSEKIIVSTESLLSYVTTNVIAFGESINEIKFEKISKYTNYTFKGWYLYKKDGTKVLFSSETNNQVVKDVLIDSAFVQDYVSDGAITFFGEFVQDCQLSIIMQDAYPTDSTFNVFKDGIEVSISGTFEYGTNLVVEVPEIDHMIFAGFEGLIDDDQFVEGTNCAHIKMNGNRSLSAKYEYIKTNVNVDTDSKLENVDVKLSSNEIQIGDTLIINANVPHGYRILKFNINGMSAQNFVKMLNENESSTVAICGDDGIVTVYVNKNIYDFFAGSSVLNIEASAKVDSTYVVLFVLYLVLTLGFGAVVIVFLILANKKIFKIKKMNRAQIDKIKEKEEKNKTESLKVKKEETKAEEVQSEKEKNEEARPQKVKVEKEKKPAEKKDLKPQSKKTVKKPSGKKTENKQAKTQKTDDLRKADKKTTEKETTKKVEKKPVSKTKLKTQKTGNNKSKSTENKQNKSVKKSNKTEGGKN